MIIVQLTYKVDINEINKYLQAHRDFLDYYYKQGLFLASGPLIPRTGGIIIALTKDKDYLQEILSKDPYNLAEVVDYSFMEFTPVMHREEIKDLILKSEGKLC